MSSAQLKIGQKSKPNQFLLVGSVNCKIFVINYNSQEMILKFDLEQSRIQQFSAAAKKSAKGSETPNMLAFMTTYGEFDMFTNSMILVQDRYGICMLNLQTQELF